MPSCKNGTCVGSEATGSSEPRGRRTYRRRHDCKKPGPLKRVWTALGLDLPTVVIMAKGGLPPVISLAALRSTSFADKYSSLGHLVAIVSLLSFAIMPRAKFGQSMMLNIVSIRHARPWRQLTMSDVRVYWGRHRSPAMSSGHICQEGNYSWYRCGRVEE
jgi:hypothetical protein